jgi:carbonic anhydrase
LHETPRNEALTVSNDSNPGRIDAILARRSERPHRKFPASKIPRTRVAVVTCMDARLDVHGILALAEGEAHMIRNAGGVATDDVLLSLAMSQRLLGTREILVMHHVGCDAGNPVLRVLQAAHTIAYDPYLVDTELVRGVLYDEQIDDLSIVCDLPPVFGVRPYRTTDQPPQNAVARNI